MKIVEMNVGPKIPYEESGHKVTFDDDLTLNLAKRQEDWDVHIDVCYDNDHTLVCGAAAGRTYVAQIDIPAKQYADPEAEGDERKPMPLNMDDVTLSLWAVS